MSQEVDARPPNSRLTCQPPSRTPLAADPAVLRLWTRWLALTVAGLIAALLSAASCPAAPAFQEGFEGLTVAWRPFFGPPAGQVIDHRRVQNDAHAGVGSELLGMAAPGGVSLPWGLPVGRISVYEFAAAMWLKANRPGVVLGARVVLPRSIDPGTQAPRTVLVRGPHSTQVGQWQQLTLSELSRALEAEVRVLRAQGGAAIDPREAYVDHLIVLVPGGSGGTAVQTDDAQIEGIRWDAPAPGLPIAPADDPQHAGALANAAPPFSSGQSHVPGGPSASAGAGGYVPPDRIRRPGVRMKSGVLTIEGRGFLPRIIQHQGETFAQLAGLGFNTIWLGALPTAAQIEQARRHGLWIICPPPSVDAIVRGAAPPSESLEVVLAWDCGSGLQGIHLDTFRAVAEGVRTWDAALARPLVVSPETELWAYSRLADVIVIRTPSEGWRPAELEDVARLRREALGVRPGTSVWIQIATSYGADGSARDQSSGQAAAEPQALVDESQMEDQVRLAQAAGCQGIVFASGSSLTERNAPARRRTLALEYLNLELALIEPWLAGGKLIGEATSSDSRFGGWVAQIERARLLLPLKEGRGGQSIASAQTARPGFNPGHAAVAEGTTLAWTVPAVPESNEVYRFSPAGLLAAPHDRVAGGIRVTLSSQTLRMVLLTEDPQVISTMQRRTAGTAVRAARLRRELAIARLEAATQAAARLTHAGYDVQGMHHWLAQARAAISRCDTHLATRNAASGYDEAERGLTFVDEAIAAGQESLLGSEQLASLPWPSGLDTLPTRGQLLAAVRRATDAKNVLYGGDFESVDQLQQFGWRHARRASPGIQSHVQLSGDDPLQGAYSLSLRAAAPDSTGPPASDDVPLVTITSPTVPVAPGQLVEVTGWVRIVRPIEAIPSRLAVYDSLGGRSRAIEITQTDGWTPFRIVRNAADATELNLTFGLSGLGTAEIDAVMIRPLGISGSGQIELRPVERPARPPLDARVQPLYLAPPRR